MARLSRWTLQARSPALIPANLTTLAHLSVLFAMSFPNSAAAPANAVPLRPARRAFIVARSLGEHMGAVPEFRAAVAHEGVVTDRTPVTGRSWEAEVSHSRVAARKHTAVARPRLVADCSPEVGHSLAATHERTAVGHGRVVAPRIRVRAATYKRTGVAYSRVAADGPAEGGHNRVAADKPAAAAHNQAAADHTRGVGRNRVAIQRHAVVAHNRVVADRSWEVAHNRAEGGSDPALQHDQKMRPRTAVLPRWQSQYKVGA